MVRILFALALALFVGRATGIASGATGEECSQPCPGDSPDGHCPPACQFCGCCSLQQTLPARPLVVMPAPAIRRAVCSAPELAPASPEPGDIFHVPKPLA
jgi:hypothetical protein